MRRAFVRNRGLLFFIPGLLLLVAGILVIVSSPSSSPLIASLDFVVLWNALLAIVWLHVSVARGLFVSIASAEKRPLS